MTAIADPAGAAAPLQYLRTFGARADPATTLLWASLIVSIAVVLIVTALLVAGLVRRRERAPALPGRSIVVHPAGGSAWISIGVGVSTLVLFAITVWTVVTLAAVARPPSAEPGADLEVIGHQWWWEVRYRGDSPSESFTTANEIHIPVGRPVHVTLNGVDVIHSFWVPALMGKTDVIPGQTNVTWMEAAAPGIYRGQCAEYCGKQHAFMGLLVIASPPDEFKAWWEHQLSGPASGPDELTADQNVFLVRCAVCHAIRGTRAGGVLGPDLSHLMTRTTLAAGALPNTPGYRAAWIADPQRIKPGSLMPQLDLSGAELMRITRYLDSLR